MSKKLTALTLTLITCLCTGCAVNPITGRQRLMLISEEQDVTIGRKYAPQIEKQMGGKIPDPAIQRYIDTVGQNIARVSHNPTLQYHFAALNHNSVNAFALPGGYVFTTKGMLEKLQTEAQLAGILAHELVHVVARHSSEVISRQIGVNILLSAVTADDTPQAVTAATNLTRQILSLKYSREHEQQADLAGLGYMVHAGYNPYAMIEAMQILRSQPDSVSIDFFSTHSARKTISSQPLINRASELLTAQHPLFVGSPHGTDPIWKILPGSSAIPVRAER